MRLNKRRKGFTIVELVVVIAVIGILAGILIPIFTNVVNNANIASDSALVNSINKQLAIAEVQDGKNKTMYDALLDAKEAGFIVANINARSNNQLVWDETIDRFAMVDKEGHLIAGELRAAKDVNLWVISQEVNEDYSTYYIGTPKVINTHKGFDAGEVEGIETINYSNDGEAQTVTIRTNSAVTNLKITAALDTINHYNTLGALNIVEAAPASYHENGKVVYAEIAKGRIVLESGSNINEIHINKKTNSSFDTVVISNNGGEDALPERITRDAVDVSTQTLVVKVESNGSSENVYVYASGTTGTTEKVTEGDNKQNANVNSALGQLVLDNGNNPGEKAQTVEQKEETKQTAVQEAVIEEIETSDKYVARIGTKPYESLKDAVNAAVANDIIDMTANDSSNENVSVNKVLTIRMNDKVFAGKIVVATSGANSVTVIGQANVDAIIKYGNRYFNAFVTATNGTVTLMKNISMTQLYKHDYSGSAKSWGLDLGGHTLTLSNNDSEGGVYIGSYYGANHSLTLSNGNIVFTGTGSKAVGFNVYGNLTLNNVNVTANCGIAFQTNAGYWDGPANLTINGGTINAQGQGFDLVAYKSGSTVKASVTTLTNVTINTVNIAIKDNGAVCNINNCNITSSSSDGIATYNSSSGSNPSTVTVSGNTTITAMNGNALNCTSGTLQINGNATVNGNVYCQSSVLTLASGTYTGNFSLGAGGQVTITGGTYNGNTISVTQSGVLHVGEEQFEDSTTYTITGSNGNYEVVVVD